MIYFLLFPFVILDPLPPEHLGLLDFLHWSSSFFMYSQISNSGLPNFSFSLLLVAQALVKPCFNCWWRVAHLVLNVGAPWTGMEVTKGFH